MKRNILIGLSILVVVFFYGCTKKKAVSDGDSTGGEVAAQNNDFSKIQPFKFTITTDLENKITYIFWIRTGHYKNGFSIPDYGTVIHYDNED